MSSTRHHSSKTSARTDDLGACFILERVPERDLERMRRFIENSVATVDAAASITLSAPRGEVVGPRAVAS